MIQSQYSCWHRISILFLWFDHAILKNRQDKFLSPWSSNFCRSLSNDYSKLKNTDARLQIECLWCRAEIEFSKLNRRVKLTLWCCVGSVTLISYKKYVAMMCISLRFIEAGLDQKIHSHIKSWGNNIYIWRTQSRWVRKFISICKVYIEIMVENSLLSLKPCILK